MWWGNQILLSNEIFLKATQRKILKVQYLDFIIRKYPYPQ